MSLVLLAATALLFPVQPPGPRIPCGPVPQGQVVPTDFVGGRFFARWRLRDSGEARFYLDTGGGFNMLAPDGVGRLGGTPEPKVVDGNTIPWVRIRRDIGDESFPPIPSDERFVTDGRDHRRTIRLLALPAEGEAGLMWQEFARESVRVDGMLGPQWFADRVWALDYPGRRLLYFGTDAVSSIPAGCWAPLGFQVDSAGHRTMHFPRITAVVDGDSVDFLFDSGATTTLTDSARQMVNPGERDDHATSFIIHARFEQWHERHPDWPILSNAERGRGSRMIRVPLIEVAGQRIGPVWFTERPDASFRRMSQWTDRAVEGALGGSAWRYATVVLDYPRARLALITPDGR